jgi:NADPH-dependent glutamate synthase beta subunit-like oxidoreductase
VIKALGFEPEDLPTLWNCPELEVTRWGTIKADFRTHETALPERLCRGRHRARREPCGLGDPRRARGGRGDPRKGHGAGRRVAAE